MILKYKQYRGQRADEGSRCAHTLARTAGLSTWTTWRLPPIAGFHLGLASGNGEKGVEAFEGLSPADCAPQFRQADYLTTCSSPNSCLPLVPSYYHMTISIRGSVSSVMLYLPTIILVEIIMKQQFHLFVYFCSSGD